MLALRRIIPARTVLVLSLAAGLGGAAALPAQAQTQAEAQAAAAVPTLDLSSSPAEAIRAAKAAQAGAQAPAAAPAASAAPAPGTVESVTVSPASEPKGRVVATTDATSLASPNFSAKDAQDPKLALAVSDTAAVGLQPVDNTHIAGFLKVNPSGKPTRTDVGLTNQF